MGSTLWNFFLHSDDHVKRFPAAAFERFHKGDAPLEVRAGKTAKFISVLMSVEGRRPVRVYQCWCKRYKLTSDGYWSDAHQLETMRDAVEQIETSSFLEEGPSKVISIAPDIAKQRYKSHSWQPTPVQLREICSYINKKAKNQILWHDTKSLEPLL